MELLCVHVPLNNFFSASKSVTINQPGCVGGKARFWLNSDTLSSVHVKGSGWSKVHELVWPNTKRWRNCLLQLGICLCCKDRVFSACSGSPKRGSWQDKSKKKHIFRARLFSFIWFKSMGASSGLTSLGEQPKTQHRADCVGESESRAAPSREILLSMTWVCFYGDAIDLPGHPHPLKLEPLIFFSPSKTKRGRLN